MVIISGVGTEFCLSLPPRGAASAESNRITLDAGLKLVVLVDPPAQLEVHQACDTFG